MIATDSGTTAEADDACSWAATAVAGPSDTASLVSAADAASDASSFIGPAGGGAAGASSSCWTPFDFLLVLAKGVDPCTPAGVHKQEAG